MEFQKKSDGILKERPGRGRKSSLSSRRERQVIRQVLVNRRMTLAQIKQYVNSQFNIVISRKDWRKVIFSDESIFRTHSCRRTQKVWRRSHERFNPKCMNFSVTHPLSVHFLQ